MSYDVDTTALWGRWLRWRVAALRTSTQCRVFPTALEIVPAGQVPGDAAPVRWSPPPDDPLDHALRLEVLLRLLGPDEQLAVVWVRPGAHEPADDDYLWLAAALTAAEVVGTDVPAVVALSRWGWRDLVSGSQRSWVRLRAG